MLDTVDRLISSVCPEINFMLKNIHTCGPMKFTQLMQRCYKYGDVLRTGTVLVNTCT